MVGNELHIPIQGVMVSILVLAAFVWLLTKVTDLINGDLFVSKEERLARERRDQEWAAECARRQDEADKREQESRINTW